MKKCDYCNKKISYDDQFCSTDCENKYFNYFKKEKKYKTIFGIFSTIGTICPFIGIYACIFHYPIGWLIASIPLMLFSICIMILPFSTEVVEKKYGLKNAITITRVFSAVLFIISIILTIIGIIKI